MSDEAAFPNITVVKNIATNGLFTGTSCVWLTMCATGISTTSNVPDTVDAIDAALKNS